MKVFLNFKWYHKMNNLRTFLVKFWTTFQILTSVEAKMWPFAFLDYILWTVWDGFFKLFLHPYVVIGIFYFCQFIKSFRPFHPFLEEEDLLREISASFTEYHIIISWLVSFRVIQPTVQWHTFKTFLFVFINFVHYKSFPKAVSQLLSTYSIKNSCDLQPQNTNQIFHMAWHVILCSIGYIDAPTQNKGIEQACSRASCDIHINPFSINLHFCCNVLLVLALDFMVHKSSYCKCSLHVVWCQVKIFLSFMIMNTSPVPAQYVGTDRILKSHYRNIL